jgi:hypothetical protein
MCAPARPAVSCRNETDCDLDSFCLEPGGRLGCGNCVHAVRYCESDADCAEPTVCVEYRDPCAEPGYCGNSFDPISSECRDRCTPDSCAFGERCGDDGHCAPLDCLVDAYECPTFTECTASDSGEGACVRLRCDTDADCGCGGGCVKGACYDTLGECLPRFG